MLWFFTPVMCFPWHQGRCSWPSKHKPCPIWHGLWQSCASTTKRCWRLSLKSQTGSNFDFLEGDVEFCLIPWAPNSKQKEIGRKRRKRYSNPATLGDFPCPNCFMFVRQGDVRLGRGAWGAGLAMWKIWSAKWMFSKFLWFQQDIIKFRSDRRRLLLKRWHDDLSAFCCSNPIAAKMLTPLIFAVGLRPLVLQ